MAVVLTIWRTSEKAGVKSRSCSPLVIPSPIWKSTCVILLSSATNVYILIVPFVI